MVVFKEAARAVAQAMAEDGGTEVEVAQVGKALDVVGGIIVVGLGQDWACVMPLLN